MKKLLTILILLIAISASANKIYINYSTGDDATGDGSLATPYKTLYKAATVAATYDTIVPAAGMTYFETSQILLPVKVNIMGGDSATTIFQSTVSANFTSMLLLASGTEGTDGSQFITGVKFIGNNYTTGWGISICARDSVLIYNCSFSKFREVGINFSGITSQNGPDAPTVYATGNKFYNNRVFDCSTNDSVYGRGCMQFGGQIGFEAYNNYIIQPYRTAGFTGNIGWPMKMANEGHIKNCKVYNDTLQRALFTGAAHGINNDWNFSFEMWNIEGLEMYGNVLQGEVDIVNATKGDYTYGLHFYDNSVSYPALSSYFQSGIRLETDEQDILIEDNLFENMEQGITWSPHDYPENPAVTGIYVWRNTIRRNRFKNMGNTAGSANSTIRFEGVLVDMHDMYLYNNTLIGATGGNATIIGIVIPDYGDSTVNNMNIVNNIIKNYSYTAIYTNTVIDTLKFQNNDLYNNADTIIFNSGAAVNYTSSGNITTNPLLEGSIDSLGVGSPCINTGLDLGWGDDMGYRQFGGGGDITAPTVTATYPTNGQTGRPVTDSVVIFFNKALDGATVTTSSAYITGVTSSVSYNSGVITINPTSDLTPSTTYTVTITTAVTDSVGNPLASNYVFTFTTAAGGGVNTTRNYCCPPY